MHKVHPPRFLLRRLRLPAVLLMTVALAFSAGIFVGAGTRSAQAQDTPPEFAVFWEVWDHVVNDFVDRDKVNFSAMTYGAIRGMLATLDDENHTSFFNPEEARQQADALGGSFEGIGAYVSQEDGVFRVVAPIHGSPAESAGILAGDVVLAVNGEDVSGQEEWEIISKIRGPAGTIVTLTVLHPGAEEPVDITIERGVVEEDSVIWTAVPGTKLAYLQLTQFAEDSDTELRAALEQITNHEPAFDGLMLDLRNNPGGYLGVATQIASEFLPAGQVILYERNAQGDLQSHVSSGSGLAREIPLIVLVNPGTASAGEILAGALQQNSRAKVVGETTLGTGTVLRPYDLSDGSMLRLGTTNWLTPDQELLKDVGVTPDAMVRLDPEIPMLDSYGLEEMSAADMAKITDPQFKSALLLLRLQLVNSR